MVVAAMSAWHGAHEAARAHIGSVSALPAHAATEAYSVLTRLPAGRAIPADAAAEALVGDFADEPLVLDRDARSRLLLTLAQAEVVGGAVYDGLVALEAATHGETLLTLDRRAAVTYRRLGIDFEIIGG